MMSIQVCSLVILNHSVISFVCCEGRPGLQSWRDPTKIPVPGT